MTHSELDLPGTSEMHLTARIGGVLHAFPVESIEEILPALPVEPVSRLPAFIRGVIFVRGQLVPVLDGAERLGLQRRQNDDEMQLICLQTGGRVLAVEVEEAIDLVSLPQNGRLPVSQLGGTHPFLAALIDFQGEILRILDPAKLLLIEETLDLDAIPSRGS